MSNVSQIYGTLRDSEPYIILNSTETEVSGNLSVLQNLDVCGNITFNNTDLSTALSNLVVDLTGGQDASFNNVEISGSLMLNNTDVSGKLTQIDASLVDLASGGGGELGLLNSTNLITTNLTSGTNFTSSGSDNIILGSHGTIPTGTIGTKNVFIGKNTALNLSNYHNNIILGDNNFKYTTGNNNIAIGSNISENYSSANNAISIGNGAATLYAQEDSICIGTNAGKHVQNKQKFIAIGSGAGHEGAGNNSIIIGNNTTYGGGVPSNSYDNVIILNATGLGGGGTNDFKPDKSNAFFVKPIQSATNSNKLLYNSTTGEITYKADYVIDYVIVNSNPDSISIGQYAGQAANTGNIAIGHYTSFINTHNSSGIYRIAIGYEAGYSQQAGYSIAIGYKSGNSNQGNNSIALGNQAGLTDQPANSIILNATGNEYNGASGTATGSGRPTNAFYVKPIRDNASASGHKLVYDNDTGEITYQPEGDISGTITLSESDSLGNIDVSLASNTLTIDAKNVSYSTNYCVPTDATSIDNITITNFRKNAQTVIYLQAHGSGTTIRGYTTHALTNIKKNFADDIVLAAGDIAILTITRIKDKYFLSASIFK